MANLVRFSLWWIEHYNLHIHLHLSHIISITMQSSWSQLRVKNVGLITAPQAHFPRPRGHFPQNVPGCSKSTCLSGSPLLANSSPAFSFATWCLNYWNERHQSIPSAHPGGDDRTEASLLLDLSSEASLPWKSLIRSTSDSSGWREHTNPPSW